MISLYSNRKKCLHGCNFTIITTQIKNFRTKLGFEILVLDSLAALYALSDLKNPRNDLFLFFENLRELGITIFLISEMGKDGEFGQHGVEEFLADGIVHLDMVRDGRNVDRFISVVKMRKTKHRMDYFPLLVEDGFEIVTK